MGTEEKPLNSLDSSHGDSSPASNQVHILTHTHQIYVSMQSIDLWFQRFELRMN